MQTSGRIAASYSSEEAGIKVQVSSRTQPPGSHNTHFRVVDTVPDWAEHSEALRSNI